MSIALWILGVAALGWLLALLLIGRVLIDYYRHRAIWGEKPICIDYIGRAELGPYYLGLSHKLDDAGRTVDETGAVVVRDASGRQWLHPVGTAHRAYAYYERYLEKRDESDRATFETIAMALIAGAEVQADGTLCWPYWIAGTRNQKLPWLSAMAQGQAIGVLCRAYQETRRPEFLAAARSALRAFCKDIGEGGVRCLDPQRGVFYEEYAYHEPGSQHHTLNGMTAALFGVYDLWKISGDNTARQIFDAGVATLRRNLAAFHFPFCSSYDLRYEHGQMVSFNPHYNSVHVAHLRVLAALAGDSYFSAVADLWDTTLRDSGNRLRLTLWYLRWQISEAGRLSREFGFRTTTAKAIRRLAHRLRKSA
jgi:heparosan-N-sulfate-glucuronate 5-epimerase